MDVICSKTLEKLVKRREKLAECEAPQGLALLLLFFLAVNQSRAGGEGAGILLLLLWVLSNTNKQQLSPHIQVSRGNKKQTALDADALLPPMQRQMLIQHSQDT